METVPLGSQGLEVSQLGLGCMGLTTAYGSKLDDEAIISLLEKAVEKGVTFWDTANLYAFPDFFRLLRFKSPVVCQEEILGRAIARIGREKVVIATKTGIELKFFPKFKGIANGSPSFIRSQCEASLSRLGVEYIDLFYLHRIDQNTPIEISMMEMKKLVEEGKIKYVGLSECSSRTIRRAHAIHPLSAVQVEYSVWCRGIEADVMKTCKELGIGIVAYSPLGRGFLGESLKDTKKYASSDFRATQERLTGEKGKKNAELMKGFEELAEKKNVTVAQLSLAWLKKQEGVVGIPGTTKLKHLESNVNAMNIDLSVEELEEINSLVPWAEIQGERYSPDALAMETWESDKNRELTDEEKEKLGI